MHSKMAYSAGAVLFKLDGKLVGKKGMVILVESADLMAGVIILLKRLTDMYGHIGQLV